MALINATQRQAHPLTGVYFYDEVDPSQELQLFAVPFFLRNSGTNLQNSNVQFPISLASPTQIPSFSVIETAQPSFQRIAFYAMGLIGACLGLQKWFR